MSETPKIENLDDMFCLKKDSKPPKKWSLDIKFSDH